MCVCFGESSVGVCVSVLYDGVTYKEGHMMVW